MEGPTPFVVSGIVNNLFDFVCLPFPNEGWYQEMGHRRGQVHRGVHTEKLTASESDATRISEGK